MATHDGAAIHFSEAGARAMGRTGHGVRVIKLRDGDYVVGVGVCRPGATVLTVTEDGKGRRRLMTTALPSAVVWASATTPAAVWQASRLWMTPMT